MQSNFRFGREHAKKPNENIPIVILIEKNCYSVFEMFWLKKGVYYMKSALRNYTKNEIKNCELT